MHDDLINRCLVLVWMGLIFNSQGKVPQYSRTDWYPLRTQGGILYHGKAIE